MKLLEKSERSHAMSKEIVETHRVYDSDYITSEEFSVYQDEWVPVSVPCPETGALLEGEMREHSKHSIEFVIYKEQSFEKGLVSGWANVAKNVDGNAPLDWQGDIIDPSDLEDAAIAFMKEYRDSGVLHEGGSTGVVVESIVMTKDKQAAMGIPEGTVPEGWFITVQLTDDDVIAKVKSGEYKMFSIQGTAEREAL